MIRVTVLRSRTIKNIVGFLLMSVERYAGSSTAQLTCWLAGATASQ